MNNGETMTLKHNGGYNIMMNHTDIHKQDEWVSHKVFVKYIFTKSEKIILRKYTEALIEINKT